MARLPELLLLNVHFDALKYRPCRCEHVREKIFPLHRESETSPKEGWLLPSLAANITVTRMILWIGNDCTHILSTSGCADTFLHVVGRRTRVILLEQVCWRIGEDFAKEEAKSILGPACVSEVGASDTRCKLSAP